MIALVGLALAQPVRADASGVEEELPPAQSRFRVFAASEGLRNLAVTSIAQDHEGFLWLGTEDGVYRYDGERFVRFSIEDGLLSTMVLVVGVLPNGQVCVGGHNGLVCRDGERFTRAQTRGIPAVAILSMATFGNKLWVGTEGAGLLVQDAAGGFVPAPGWPGSPTGAVRSLWADAHGLVVAEGGTVASTAGNGVWHPLGDVGLTGERVDGVLRDRQGALWIRTHAHLWYVPHGASRATDLQDGLPTSYATATSPSSMVVGPRGNVLIGTDAGIAYRAHDRWRTIDRATGMPAAMARALFVDREGTLWVGSIGLFQLRGRGLIEHYDAAGGLPGEIVWRLRRDREGALWMGTNQCLVHAVAGRWQCLRGTEGRIVRSFVFTPQGGVFVGGAPAELLYVDAEGKATSLGDFGAPVEDNILGLELGPDGDLWIATRAGLYRLPGGVPGRLEQVVIPGISATARYASLLVADGRLWTAITPGGVAVLDGGRWRVFDRASGLRGQTMSYLTRRADGRICATYTEAIGLTCFRYDGRAITGLEHISGEQLSSGMVYFVGEDHQQRLWIGTGSGIDVITPRGRDHFDDSDGIAGNDATAMGFLSDPDGSLWFGSTGGVSHVFAQDYVGPPPAPRTLLLDGRLGDHVIRGAADAQRALEVPHDRNALTLEFTAGSLLDVRRAEYQVRLSPLETEWSTTPQHQARYLALLPGSYRFEVRARIAGGAWGPTTQLSFTVRPAWWQPRWLMVAMVLVGLVTIGAVFTWRQRTVLRRRTRQLHEQSDMSFRVVIDQLPDMISLHRGGKLIYMNRAYRRFLGLDGPGDRWMDLDPQAPVHRDDREAVAQLFRRVRDIQASRVPEVIEIRMTDGKGRERICEVSGLLVEIGGASTVVASGRDVTERKRLRAKLMLSDRMASLGTLAAGIAHEINNPLAYVMGNLESIGEALEVSDQDASAAGNTQLRAAIADARDGVERMRKIVYGLRSFSRHEQDHRVPLALPGVIDAAIRLTGNEVRHRAQLVRELGPTPLVMADDGRLTQVFINLLTNAAHAIPDGRSNENRITVRTRTDDQGRAVIEVEDTGAGIAPEVLSRVFDPFFTTKEVGEGTGLGLAICHGIISGIGGQITIDSAIGRGTVVRVVLPGAASVPTVEVREEAPPAAPEPRPTRRPRVMLVDDEPLIAQTMERLLSRDYDITVALTAKDAIDHVAGGVRFDAIVSDVMMPNMTGIELLEELERVAPDQARRVIFLSGGAFTTQTRERLDQLGAPQLEKPVSAKELRAWVGRVASEPAAPAP